ncbi:hypothetical protein AAY473_036801, partial [Plecturocebus cupreus]
MAHGSCSGHSLTTQVCLQLHSASRIVGAGCLSSSFIISTAVTEEMRAPSITMHKFTKVQLLRVTLEGRTEKKDFGKTQTKQGDRGLGMLPRLVSNFQPEYETSHLGFPECWNY